MVEQGCYETIEEAEKDNPIFVMECEIYYDKHSGLFGGLKNLYYLCSRNH